MAWFDIVGGLAGGLQQGLGQLQQAQQAKKVEARQQALLQLQQAQEERAAEQFKREQNLAALSDAASLLAKEDPFNVSAQTIQAIGPEAAKRFIVQNPQTNAFEVRMAPEERNTALQKMRIAGQQRQLYSMFTESGDSPLTAKQAVLFSTIGGVPPEAAFARITDPKEKDTFLLTMGAKKPEELWAKKADIEARRDIAKGQQATSLQVANIGRMPRPIGAEDVLKNAAARVTTAERNLSAVRLKNLSLPPNDPQGMQELTAAAQDLAAAQNNYNSILQSSPATAKFVQPQSVMPVTPQANNPFRK